MRRLVLDAARLLFLERGYAKATLKQIAAASGVSSSVLFRNFASKTALLMAIVEEPFDDIIALLEEGVRNERRAAITDLVHGVLEHRDVLRCVLGSLTSPDGDRVMAELGARLDASLVAIGRPDIDCRLIVAAVTSLAVLDDWFLPEGTAADDPLILRMLSTMSVHAPGAVRPRPRRARLRVSGKALSVNGVAGRGTQRRSSDAVRAALLEAATSLFRDRGYAGSSYRDIAAAAGTSESVLYRHFGSKSRLLAEAVLQPFAERLEEARDGWNLADPATRWALQTEYLGQLFSVCSANHGLIRILMALAQDPDEDELRLLIASHFTQMFARLRTEREAARGATVVGGREGELRTRLMVAVVMTAAALDDLFLQGEGVFRGAEPVVLVISNLLDRLGKTPAEQAARPGTKSGLAVAGRR